ncbi:MAG: DUF4157 domain-containing protein [Deltaproteobacteria bacterium]|nr:DUF4157 domain-containing protein [Kofleriaceae bacterium]
MVKTFEQLTASEVPSAPANVPAGAPGKRALTDRLQRRASGSSPPPAPALQRKETVAYEGLSTDVSYVDSILGVAAEGTSGPASALPFLERIQSSFGKHDVSGVQAHTDTKASTAATSIGAHAYATGNHVAFAGDPDLHTAAHEAAHVVQQRAGVHLKGGVGEEGDRYERHADAVADAVVRGDSAEALLDTMAPASTDGTGVQLSAVQLDEMELGPAGRPAGSPVGAGDSGGGAGQTIGRGLGTAARLGSAALPHIKTAFETIQAIKGIWDLLKPGGGKGETKQLPEAISGYNKLELDRVIRYAVAEKYLEEAFAIGLRHGVDFTKWQNGMAPAAPAKEPAAPAKEGEQSPTAARPFIAALEGLAIEDLKDRALQELKTKVASNSVRMAPVSYWWNGADERGYGDPPNYHGFGGDRDTWGKVTFRIAGAKLPEGTPAGIPQAASHFGVTPNFKYVVNLGWFNAGRVETETSEDMLDDLSIRHVETSWSEGVNQPVGAHHLAFEFIWDDSNTVLDVDVTFFPMAWLTHLENITAEGEPET